MQPISARDADSESTHRFNEDETEDKQGKQKKHNCCLKFLADNWFMLATIAGVCLGFALAFSLRTAKLSSTAITWISMPADVYLRLLQLTIMPLIASNILVAMATLDFKRDGKVGLVGIIYIILIDLICAIIGTGCSLIIQPGSRVFLGNTSDSAPSVVLTNGLTASDVFKDLFYNIFPDNILSITIFHYQTTMNAYSNVTVGNAMTTGTNMVGVLFCSIIFGAAAKACGDDAKPFIDFFRSVSYVVTKIMAIFLLVTPMAVLFMVASSVIDRENIESDFVQLGLFVATVITALAIHFILIVMVFFISSRKNPFRLLKYSAQAYVLAFATTSPALALPETYMGLDKYGVRQSVSRLLGPLLATLKGDGPAAFIAAGVIFVAQNAHMDLNVGQIFTVLFLTFFSSLAAPNIPSASMVLIVTILSSIGVPSQGASLLFAMEWLLDRCRSGSGALSMMFLPATTEVICNSLDRREIRRKGNPLDDNFDLSSNFNANNINNNDSSPV